MNHQLLMVGKILRGPWGNPPDLWASYYQTESESSQNVSAMDILTFFEKVWEENPHYIMVGGLLLIISLAGKARMFAKADQPPIAALVPIWDLVIVLKMVGRPVSHLAFLLVPVYNVYFAFKLLIEIAQSFGKRSVVDYVLVCVFNVFYLLNLALAYNEEYEGPVYGKSELKDVQHSETALA